MNALRLLLRALPLSLRGKRGDAAVLAAVALDFRGDPELERQLRNLAEPLPTFDLVVLRGLMPGSFGRTYAHYMDLHARQPLHVSGSIAAQLRGNPFALRYLALRDVLHVLLGFEYTLAGRLGIWAFASAQGYGPACDRAARLASCLYPLLAPWQRPQLRRAEFRGRRLGALAACLLLQPLEPHWALPLNEVRRLFGLPFHFPSGPATARTAAR